MSTLAKIFVVFNLVLTVVFFGSSATLYLNRESWREKYQEMQKLANEKVDELETALKDQKAKYDAVKNDNSGLKTEVTDLAASNKKLETAIAQLNRDLNQEKQNVQAHMTTLQETNKTLQEKERAIAEKDNLIAQLQEQTQEARAAQEKAVNDVSRLVLDLNKLQEEHSRTLVTLAKLQDELEKNEIVFANAAKRGVDLKNFEVPPIEGVVEAVNDKDRLVVLSVGRDQKTQEGFDMFVRRGGEFIGKLKVIRVFPDLSGARVVYTVPGRTIQVGDQVATTE